MKNCLICIFLLFCCVCLCQSQTNDELTQRKIHSKVQFDNIDYNDIFLRIVIKFHDGTGIRSDAELRVVDEMQNLSKLRARGLSLNQIESELNILNRFLKNKSLIISRLIDAPEDDVAEQISNAESYWGEEMPELQTYMQIVLKEQFNPELRSWIADLKKLSIIEIIYPESMARSFGLFDEFETLPPIDNKCDLDFNAGDLSTFQGYRKNPPQGLGVSEVNKISGGKGEGISIVDIEGGYLSHIDHKKPFQIVGHTTQYYDHGVQVVGVLSSIDNQIGVTGIAPESDVGVRSIYNKNLFESWDNAMQSSANVANNIYWASKHSLNGVVLIELQRLGPDEPNCLCSDYGCKLLPVEYWSAEYDVIKVATGNGTAVVEAAGNGSRNLDHDVLNNCQGGCFDKNNRDSGAVLVSGSLSDGVTPICGISSPNYGDRIDVHSWAENVATTSLIKKDLYFENSYHSCNRYTNSFNGTSSASAIIAGAVAILKGIYKYKNLNNNIDTLKLRKILISTGTPQAELVINGKSLNIGTQPNLIHAIEEVK